MHGEQNIIGAELFDAWVTGVQNEIGPYVESISYRAWELYYLLNIRSVFAADKIERMKWKAEGSRDNSSCHRI